MPLSFIKNYLQFVLSIIGVVLLFILGLRGLDVTTAISSIIIGYAGSRAIIQGNAAWAASKDESCDTAKVIEQVKEK